MRDACLINASKAHAGGGITVAIQLIDALEAEWSHLNYRYYVLASPELVVALIGREPRLTIVEVPSETSSGLNSVNFYLRSIPGHLRDWGISVIFNLGDIIPPVSPAAQVYFCDYPFIVRGLHSAGFKGADYIKQTIKRKLIRIGYRRNAITVCQSEAMFEELASSFPEVPVHILPMPLSPIRGDMPGRTRDPHLFVYVASPSDHKNHEILYEVAVVLQQRRLNYAVAITCSPDDNALTERFYRRLTEAGLADYVSWRGKLSLSEVRALYTEAIASVNPSLAETFGLVYYECMQMHTPQAVSDLDFAREACGPAAVYFDPRDAASIVDRMHALATSAPLRQRLVEAGDQRIAGLCDTGAYVVELENLLTKAQAMAVAT